MGLKARTVRRMLRKRFSETSVKRTFVNLDSAQNVGIIWKEEDVDAFQKLKNLLESKGVRCTAICWSKRRKQEKATISDADFSFRGIPVSTTVKTFVDEPLDLLIDISQSSHPCLEAVRALSQAGCKTGSSNANSVFLDLTIVSPPSFVTMELVEQLVYYLTSIKTK